MQYRYDVFISFSWDDLRLAQTLHDRLCQAGFAVWYAREKIPLGGNMLQRIRDGLHHSRFLLVVHTESSANSRWAAEEVDAVRLEEIRSGIDRIIFLRFDGAEVPFDVRQKKYVDVREHDPSSLDELISTLAATSQQTISDLEASLAARKDTGSCARRLSEIATNRCDLEAFRALARTMSAVADDHDATDAVAWSMGQVAIWANEPAFLEEVKSALAAGVALGHDQVTDKLAYTCGQVALNACNKDLRNWARDFIADCSRSDDARTAEPFAYTSRRIAKQGK